MKAKIIIISFLFLSAFSVFLYIWYRQVETDSHYEPDYERQDLKELLQKDFLEEEDYRTLFYQTGLGPGAINEILSGYDDPLAELADYQKRFFAPVNVVCQFNTPLSKEERITESKVRLIPCEDAYILITSASHVLFYRNGHAGLVVDAAKGQTLEAAVMGADSAIQNIAKWKTFPNFAVLRLKHTDPQLSNKICRTAVDKLKGIPYRLSSGLWSAPPDPESLISSTHCSHLVWSAFYMYGIDLDSDGGHIVTPRDILESNSLEIIQIYGMDPAGLEELLFPPDAG